MKVVDHLIKAIRSTADYNPGVQVAPCCILWPDPDCQWEPVIPRLKTQIPELFILGDYEPEEKRGPAIWLRCVIENMIPGSEPPPAAVPVLYLPGVGRQILRTIEELEEDLKPLAELQYRGVYWSQANSKDWTVLAYLISEQGGVGLDLARDQGTRKAMLLALPLFLEEEIGPLKGKRLDKDYFNGLLIDGDPMRQLLRWLDQGKNFRDRLDKNKWQAFVDVSISQFQFNPEKEGLLKGAEKFASHEGPWQQVWQRYCEAPLLYPNIPTLIRKCQLPEDSILWRTGHGFEGWPQWNEEQEEVLCSELKAVAQLAPHEARQAIINLEESHGRRRKLIWAKLGEAPLAGALEHLARLAETTTHSLAGGTFSDLAAGYLSQGWQADDALTKALSYVKKPVEQEAVFASIRAVYYPWADQSARYLQQLVGKSGYPAGSIGDLDVLEVEQKLCFLFIDGLRFDLARRLADELKLLGYQVEEKIAWAVLPSLTATGKPAVSPVRHKITGQSTDRDFAPSVAETGQSLKGGYHFNKLLDKEGWTILDEMDTGEDANRAWAETGNIDRYGHSLGWKLAWQLESLMQEIIHRIIQLLDTGWPVLRIITDHGWLLLPGGLPKVELPSSLTENQWGRCAILKPGAVSEEKFYPWFWNPEFNFALAPGIGCYRRGEEYTHGGLSLQECLTLELKITAGAKPLEETVEVIDLTWRGMRCFVATKGSYGGLSLDIRIHPGDPSTSVVLNMKKLREDGTASAVVDREELEGSRVTVLLLNMEGVAVTQVETIIGEGDP